MQINFELHLEILIQMSVQSKLVLNFAIQIEGLRAEMKTWVDERRKSGMALY